MQVTIIGSGNIATVLGSILVKKEHTIHQVWSRHYNHAVALAKELAATPVPHLAALDANADLYLLAVTDDAIATVAGQLSLGDKLLVHTAGSVSKEVLKGASSAYGVLWPMRMVRKSMTTLEPATIVVDGNTETVTREIETIAAFFSPFITKADDAMRVKMHMLAVFTANFSNHLYHLAFQYCQSEGIDFTLFYSIIRETAGAIQQQDPASLQAGPAFRGDRQTMERQINLLENYPHLQDMYRFMSKSIMLLNEIDQ
jgi:predicted short-subunit dehydrogenase-like oxidoreductase (DUF2520 family)